MISTPNVSHVSLSRRAELRGVLHPRTGQGTQLAAFEDRDGLLVENEVRGLRGEMDITGASEALVPGSNPGEVVGCGECLMELHG